MSLSRAALHNNITAEKSIARARAGAEKTAVSTEGCKVVARCWRREAIPPFERSAADDSGKAWGLWCLPELCRIWRKNGPKLRAALIRAGFVATYGALWAMRGRTREASGLFEHVGYAFSLGHFSFTYLMARRAAIAPSPTATAICLKRPTQSPTAYTPGMLVSCISFATRYGSLRSRPRV